MRKEVVIVTCLDQVNIITQPRSTQPKLEVECNQDIDYRKINKSLTNSHYIDPNCSSLRERRNNIIVYLKWSYNLLEGLE